MDSVNQTKSLCKRTVFYGCGGVATGMQECKFFKAEPTKNTCSHFQVSAQECRCRVAIKNAEEQANNGDNTALVEALAELVRINEEHNASIEAIIGKPFGWKDKYLDKARSILDKIKTRANNNGT